MAQAQRTAHAVPSHVLELFWALASVESGKREVRYFVRSQQHLGLALCGAAAPPRLYYVAAAAVLADELKAAQAAFDSQRASPDAPGGAAIGGEEAVAPVALYSLRRLARGLGSGREGARQGFALALTGALTVLPSVSGEQAVTILLENSEPVTGSSKGAEARDIYLGKLFGFAAVGRALEARRGAGGAAADTTPLLARMAQEVALLARKKGYLREAGAVILIELLRSAPSNSVAALLQAAPALEEWLCSPVESADAETLLLALELADRLPGAWKSRCPVLPAGEAGAVLEREHLGRLLPALLSSTSAHPRTHCVWGIITRMLLKSPAGTVEAFWEVACEQSLFTSSHERKFLGFELFSSLLPCLNAEAVPALFSHNFMRCLVNSLSKNDTLLHNSASSCLANLLAFVQTDIGAPLQTPVVAALQRFAGGRFDKLTQTTAVSTLMQSLSGDNAAAYVQTLFASFLVPGGDAGSGEGCDEDENAARVATGRRVWSVEQLCGICRSARTPTLQLTVSRFLLLHAFFEQPSSSSLKLLSSLPELSAGAPKPLLPPAVRELCKTRLFGLLAESQVAAHSAAREPDAGEEEVEVRKARAEQACAQTLELVESCCAAAEAMLQPAAPLGADALGVRSQLRALLPDLDRLASGAGSSGRIPLLVLRADAARTLVRLLLLQQLGSPADYSSDLQDLPRCLSASLEAAGGALAAAPAAARAPAAGDEPAPHHMDVLIEILLSLLSKPSALTRDAVERTFRAFAPTLTAEGLRCMLRVITRRSGGARGRGRRGAVGSDDDDEADEEDEEEEEEDEDEGEEGEGEEVEAAGSSKRAHKAAADSSESDEEEEEAMDDDAMFRTDALLAAVLTQTKAARGDKKTAAEATLHFKFRVISLLEAFIKSQPSSPLLLGMLLPLLQAIFAAQGSTSNEALVGRIGGLVTSVCKASAPAGVPLEELLAKYATCFKHASRRLVPGLNRPAVTACLFLLRLAGEAEASEGVVADRLLEALAFYWDSKKCRLPHSFFVSALERFPAASGAVLTFLSEQLAAAAGATALNGRAEYLVAEAAKLSAAALSRRPGSASAVATAAGLQPSAVLRGLVAALGLKLSKPKRTMELFKQLAACVQALQRLCTGQQLAAPSFAPLLAATRAAKMADPLPPPKAIAQLDRIVELVQGAPKAAKRQSGEGGQGGGSAKKKARVVRQ